jgi:hypothetical protein
MPGMSLTLIKYKYIILMEHKMKSNCPGTLEVGCLDLTDKLSDDLPQAVFIMYICRGFYLLTPEKKSKTTLV